jgi:hypothetical protein
MPAGACGYREVRVDERRQPNRRLAAIRLTVRPGNRPRLCRTHLRLRARWLQLRTCVIKAFGPTLHQHVEPHVTAIKDTRRRGRGPQGSNCAD